MMAARLLSPRLLVGSGFICAPPSARPALTFLVSRDLMDPGDDQLKMYGLVQAECTKQYSVRGTYFGPRKEKRS